MADTSKAPERIWIEDERHIGGSVNVSYEPPSFIDEFVTVYVRADLYDAAHAEVARLTAALAEAETRGAERMREAALSAYADGEEWDTFGSFIACLRALPLPPRERDGQEGGA